MPRAPSRTARPNGKDLFHNHRNHPIFRSIEFRVEPDTGFLYFRRFTFARDPDSSMLSEINRKIALTTTRQQAIGLLKRGVKIQTDLMVRCLVLMA